MPCLFAALVLGVSLRRGVFYAPAVGRDAIVFVRGNELWRVPKAGGEAAPLGVWANANSQPRLSPDGRSVALLTDFDGAYDLGTVPLAGGPAHRVTHYPRNGKGLSQWLPDGRLVYFTESDFRVVESAVYTVPATGGLPTKLPVPYGADPSLSADGKRLAYTLHMRPNLWWKRYRGGMASDVWIVDIPTGRSKRVTTWKGYDCRPMWHGDRLYYLTDEGAEGAMNLWVYDAHTGHRRQVTHKRGADIQSPSISTENGEIAYAWEGDIWTLDLATGKDRRVDIRIPEAAQRIAPRKLDVGDWTVNRTLAPDGERVAVEARGDLWLVPPTGAPKNLTGTDGAFERDPAWSPDGRWLACFSDEGGEYQLTLIDPRAGSRRPLTGFEKGFRQTPRWSPDSRRIAFTDDAGGLFVASVEGGAERFDADPLGQIVPLAWSPDSRWIVYSRYGANQQTALWAYDTQEKKTRRLTSGMASDSNPVFSPDGKTLYFLSVRDYGRRVEQVFDRASVYLTPSVVMAAPFAGDVEGEAARLPIPSGRFRGFDVGHGRLFLLRADPEHDSVLQSYDLAGGDPKTVLAGADGFELGRKILATAGGKAYVLDGEGKREITAAGFETTIDPTREWAQIARDEWRLFRDYFYDPAMRGLDWEAQWRRLAPLLARCATRDDVNYALGEMISELSVGHAMMTAPGDLGPSKPWVAPGQLGVDFELRDGAYRISKIVQGAAWDPDARGPLAGTGVREGEYLLAVEGRPLDFKEDPWAAFMGRAGRATKITVGPRPTLDGSRTVEVKPLARESDLRLHAWVERNRRMVEKASGGKLGYLYVADEGQAGFADFARQFYAQTDKQGLVVDARWNSGGSGSDRMIEMLNRPLLNAYAERYSTQSFPVPDNRVPGPKCLLINRVTSSAGENLAFYFRKAGLGKLIGTRTWGGLIGVNGNQALIDGGFWWIPQSAFFVDAKQWMPEGIGIAPDLEVMDDPAQMRDGRDPQIEAAVRHLLGEIARKGEPRPIPPRIGQPQGD